jgi:HEAT repeat protein
MALACGHRLIRMTSAGVTRRLDPKGWGMTLFWVHIITSIGWCLVSQAGAAPPDNATATAPASVPTASTVDRRITENLQLLTGQNEPKARLLGARGLLLLSESAAWERLAGVLANPDDPLAQMAVCQAVADASEQRPILIGPLLELLASESSELRLASVMALARYRDHGVIDRLSRLAEDNSKTLRQRRAAIETLAAMSDDRKAIEQLIALLDSDDAELASAAMNAIADGSGVELAGAEEARRWWAEVRDLDQSEWLRLRNEQWRQRMRRLEGHAEMLTRRLLAGLRANYHAASESDKPRLLLEHLRDPLPEVRSFGIELVNAIITDRKPVPDEVSAQLATMISDASPVVRRRVVTVLGDLRDRSIAPRLIDAIGREPDGGVRGAIVSALGRIGGEEAAVAVRAALDDPVPAVVSEAALALASVVEPGDLAPDGVADFNEALRSRYERIEPLDAVMREAFLTSMARIADPSFRPLFLEAIDTRSHVRVRRAALRGLAATDDGTSAPMIRPFLDDPSPGIRLAAAEALGRCGRTDDDLNTLVQRLDPALETDDPVRLRAWDGVQRILRGRSVEEQLSWAERFNRSDNTVAMERYAALLGQIERRLAERNPPPPLRYDVLDRLGDANVVLGRHASAAAFFEQSFLGRLAAGHEGAESAMLNTLEALLVARRFDAVAALLSRAGANGAVGSGSATLDLDKIAARLDATLNDRLVRDEIDAATALADQIERWLESNPLLGEERRAALQTRLDEVRKAANGRRISTLLQQLGQNGVAAEQAELALSAIGRDALPRLVEELERRAAPADEPDPLEGRLVAIVRRIEPRWEGFGADVDEEGRRQALAELRNILAEMPTP